MVVIKLNRRLLKAAAAIVLAGAIVFCTYSILRNTENASRSTSASIDGSPSEDTSINSFLTSDDFYSQGYKYIEIFDIGKGSVIKRVQSNDTIQGEAEKYIEGITGMYTKVMAFPGKGYIIRIPLDLPIMTQGQWLKGIVNEIFVIFPEKGKPYLLILDDKSRPVFYNFKNDTGVLLKSLDFKPDTLG